MSLASKLQECLEWVDEHGGSLVFERGGTVALVDEEGDTCGQVDGFTVERGADVLAELLEDASEAEPPTLLPLTPVEQVTWFGFGTNPFDWGERRIITVTPDREMLPRSLRVPSTCAGYVIYQALCAGEPLLTENDGIPVELFGEGMAAPQILFPSIGPGRSFALELRAPPCPKAPPAFSGALYGHLKETRK